MGAVAAGPVAGGGHECVGCLCVLLLVPPGLDSLAPEEEERKEVYTRPLRLPLTSCQEDRLGLDYTVLCHD